MKTEKCEVEKLMFGLSFENANWDHKISLIIDSMGIPVEDTILNQM